MFIIYLSENNIFNFLKIILWQSPHRAYSLVTHLSSLFSYYSLGFKLVDLDKIILPICFSYLEEEINFCKDMIGKNKSSLLYSFPAAISVLYGTQHTKHHACCWRSASLPWCSQTSPENIKSLPFQLVKQLLPWAPACFFNDLAALPLPWNLCQKVYSCHHSEPPESCPSDRVLQSFLMTCAKAGSKCLPIIPAIRQCPRSFATFSVLRVFQLSRLSDSNQFFYSIDRIPPPTGLNLLF